MNNVKSVSLVNNFDSYNKLEELTTYMIYQNYIFS